MRERSSAFEWGQGLPEYALVIALVALAVILGLTFMGQGIADSIYNDIVLNAILSI